MAMRPRPAANPEHLAQVEPAHWSEQLPDWSDWTA